MSHIITVKLDKLRMWCAGRWKTYNTNHSISTNFTLQIYYDQLLILLDNKVLESLNLNGKVKGIYKDDVLILILCQSSQQNQMRKIKFQITSNILECLQKLSLHFPVVHFNSVHSTNHYNSKYKNIEDVLKTAINGGEKMSGAPLPTPFKEFFKLCLLDPTFPQLVSEAENILEQEILNKNSI